MMTVSAVARLMPRPPARVDNRKQNAGEPTADKTTRHTTGSSYTAALNQYKITSLRDHFAN